MNTSASIGRNDPCPCGSGKKYKRCCLVPGASTWPSTLSSAAPAVTVPKKTKVTDEESAAETQFREMETFLKQGGVDPNSITDASPEGVQRWVDEQFNDPSKKRILDAALAAHPEITKITTRDLNNLEDYLLDLLENHPDAPLLTMEEMELWLRDLGEKIKPIQNPAKPHWWNLKPKPITKKEFTKLVHETTELMAEKLFTLERIEQLRQEMQEFAKTLVNNGDEDEGMTVRKGILLLPPDATPENCDFLVRYAFRSLRVALFELKECAQQTQDGTAEESEA